MLNTFSGGSDIFRFIVRHFISILYYVDGGHNKKAVLNSVAKMSTRGEGD